MGQTRLENKKKILKSEKTRVYAQKPRLKMRSRIPSRSRRNFYIICLWCSEEKVDLLVSYQRWSPQDLL
jgi:hypothetical protein